MWADITLVLAFVLIGGFFAAAEIALVGLGVPAGPANTLSLVVVTAAVAYISSSSASSPRNGWPRSGPRASRASPPAR